MLIVHDTIGIVAKTHGAGPAWTFLNILHFLRLYSVSGPGTKKPLKSRKNPWATKAEVPPPYL